MIGGTRDECDATIGFNYWLRHTCKNGGIKSWTVIRENRQNECNIKDEGMCLKFKERKIEIIPNTRTLHLQKRRTAKDMQRPSVPNNFTHRSSPLSEHFNEEMSFPRPTFDSFNFWHCISCTHKLLSNMQIHHSQVEESSLEHPQKYFFKRTHSLDVMLSIYRSEETKFF